MTSPVEVSILVLLDVGLPGEPPRRACTGMSEFRSLFSWMSVCRTIVAGVRPAHRSFDPCSPGCSVCRRRGTPAGTSALAEFRSLFSWMSVCRARSRPVCASLGMSFDPCSPGCRSAGLGARRTAGLMAGVSILVLLDVGLPAAVTRPRAHRRARFRSLFSWMSVCRQRRATDAVDAASVSILVLLDVGLPARDRSRRQPTPLGFDPCSPGCSVCRLFFAVTSFRFVGSMRFLSCHSILIFFRVLPRGRALPAFLASSFRPKFLPA